ncbi:serine/threonine-protein kinase [Streptomyces coeruleorubidus]|uniref:serine/threonine-protein kinase n=1 Tax=Streptomyces coeruleorubidus TaxID=116188 RepID=UPI0037B026BA
MVDTVHAGEVIGSRYTLIRALGAGGFGRVWQAHDEDLHVDVALKQVRLAGPVTPEEQRQRIARAVREARHAARLRDHPNVVTVHDAFEYDGGPWIVMQYVQGRSLAEELRQHQRLPIDQVAQVAEAVLSALQAAHTANIVHRDIKPGNVLIAADGHVLLTDFGIAVALTDVTLTATSVVIGSPGYVAPERWRGAELGPAADLFALGVTLYEAVEGEPPFDRRNPVAALTEEPRPPQHAGRLGSLLLRLLEKAPARRPDAAAARALLATDRATARSTTRLTKVITKERASNRRSERPPSGEPATITSGRMATVRVRGTELGNGGTALAGIGMAILVPLLMSDGDARVGDLGMAGSMVIIVMVGCFFGYALGWVQGTWEGLFGDLDSLTVSPGGLTVTGQTSAECEWDDLTEVRLEQSAGTVRLIVTVRPECASDKEWQVRNRLRLDTDSKAEVFVGHGIPAGDAHRVMAALSRYAGNLYNGPASLP